MRLTIVFLELYSYAYTSGEQNAAISYIILHLTYIRGLIHGIGRGVPNDVVYICGDISLTKGHLGSRGETYLKINLNIRN